MGVLDWIGSALGLLSFVLAMILSVWTWPLRAATVVLSGIALASRSEFARPISWIILLVSLAISIFGFLRWSSDRSRTAVASTPKELALWTAGAIVLSFAVTVTGTFFGIGYAWFSAFSVALVLLGLTMMAFLKRECWFFLGASFVFSTAPVAGQVAWWLLIVPTLGIVCCAAGFVLWNQQAKTAEAVPVTV